MAIVKKTFRDLNMTVSAPELARFFGVTAQTLSRWHRDYGMPKAGHGRYALRDCTRWLIDFYRSRQNRELTEVRKGLIAARRQRIEFDLQRQRAQVFDAELVGDTIHRMASAIVQQLEALGPRLAGDLAMIDNPLEIQARIVNEVNQTRSAMARTIGDLGSIVDNQKLETSD